VQIYNCTYEGFLMYLVTLHNYRLVKTYAFYTATANYKAMTLRKTLMHYLYSHA